MTLVKSKYYMLKVSYPKLAEQVDSDPIDLDENESLDDKSAERPEDQMSDLLKFKPMQDSAGSIEHPVDQNQKTNAEQIKEDKKRSKMLDA
jgi:hypothetical protein